MSFIFLYLFLCIMILVSIAFFTLLERKILGYIHMRKGPNKIIILGLFQPIFDGLKLFMKEMVMFVYVNKFMFFLFPLISLFLMFMFWMNFIYMKMSYMILGMVYFIMISGLGVYPIMGSGWSSNSKYSLLGSYRSVAQVVSYEVTMIFIMMMMFVFVKSYNLNSKFIMMKISHMLLLGFNFVFLIMFIAFLAELNRAPFDFAESESELVSGFNVEYGGLKFAFLFLAEYGNMIFMSYMMMVLVLDDYLFNMIMLMMIMVWVRGVLPRYRYDNLMKMNWELFLPVMLIMFMFVLVIFI